MYLKIVLGGIVQTIKLAGRQIAESKFKSSIGSAIRRLWPISSSAFAISMRRKASAQATKKDTSSTNDESTDEDLLGLVTELI